MLNSKLAGDFSWNGNEINVLFRNEGDLHFSEIGFISGFGLKEDSRSMTWADFDGDGDLDVITNSLDSPASYLRNNIGTKQHHIAIRLVGKKSNRDGIGARIWVEAGGRTQMREHHAGYSYLAQGQGQTTYVGLGSSKTIDRLRVRWPSGTEDLLRNVPAGRIVTIHEGSFPEAPATR